MKLQSGPLFSPRWAQINTDDFGTTSSRSDLCPSASIRGFSSGGLARWALLLLVAVLVGCASPLPVKEGRRFDFPQDTFAFANELVWEYEVQPELGTQTWRKRAVPPDYSHHCFVVVRAARQFWWHARFDPSLPRTNAAAYRDLVQEVVSRADDAVSPFEKRITIPGYANLRAFSAEHAPILQQECGGAWRSYLQRGHWRMVFPFSRPGQAANAADLKQRLEAGIPCVVHLVDFPGLKINHAVLLFDVRAEPNGDLVFQAYDPNTIAHPEELFYSAQERRFTFPTNRYFVGGAVDVYEVYRGWIY